MCSKVPIESEAYTSFLSVSDLVDPFEDEHNYCSFELTELEHGRRCFHAQPEA